MVAENPTSGEERIARRIALKLGVRVRRVLSPISQTAAHRKASRGQRWSPFVRNQADACGVRLLCLDYCSFPYHWRLWPWRSDLDASSPSTSPSTPPRLDASATARDSPGDHRHRFLLHDEQESFSAELDDSFKINESAALFSRSGEAQQQLQT
jgi:hypothetical protein